MQVDCLRISLWTISAEKVGHGGACWGMVGHGGANGIVTAVTSLSVSHCLLSKVVRLKSTRVGFAWQAIIASMVLWWMPLRRQWMTPRTFHCWRNWLKLEAIGGIFHIGDFECQRFSTDVEKRHSAISVWWSVVAMTGKPARGRRIISQISQSQNDFTASHWGLLWGKAHLPNRSCAFLGRVLVLAHHNHHTSMRITSYITQHSIATLLHCCASCASCEVALCMRCCRICWSSSKTRESKRRERHRGISWA